MAFQLFSVSPNKGHFQVGLICVGPKGVQELDLVKFISLENFHHWFLLLQSWTEYMRRALVFVWSSSMREDFNIYFSVIFCWYRGDFGCGGTGHYVIILRSFEIFLIFPNFLSLRSATREAILTCHVYY